VRVDCVGGGASGECVCVRVVCTRPSDDVGVVGGSEGRCRKVVMVIGMG
jgi:hypothetical protein